RVVLGVFLPERVAREVPGLALAERVLGLAMPERVVAEVPGVALAERIVLAEWIVLEGLGLPRPERVALRAAERVVGIGLRRLEVPGAVRLVLLRAEGVLSAAVVREASERLGALRRVVPG